MELPARYWDRVEKTETCWNWTAAKNDVGYGQLRHKGKTWYVHRLGFEAAYGPIEPGVLIDHMCHNPACVNPAHLRTASRKQNAENLLGARADSKSGIRGVWFVPKSGRWTGQVGHRGVRHSIGSYGTAEEANAAAIAKRLELFTHNDADRTAA